MATERKTVMISARLPAELVDRVDFVARNSITPGAPVNRSSVLHEALKSWLPAEERSLEKLLGPSPKKAR